MHSSCHDSLTIELDKIKCFFNFIFHRTSKISLVYYLV